MGFKSCSKGWEDAHLKNFLRHAIEKKRQYLIEQLIALGAYREDDKQLFTLTLTELETEYEYFSKISQEKEASGRE